MGHRSVAKHLGSPIMAAFSTLKIAGLVLLALLPHLASAMTEDPKRGDRLHYSGADKCWEEDQARWREDKTNTIPLNDDRVWVVENRLRMSGRPRSQWHAVRLYEEGNESCKIKVPKIPMMVNFTLSTKPKPYR